ncbi:hypothetical protein [Flavobacterium sp. NKUCC04_CG]|uniref:hypothetical protein n=1 Tax=Flavobacterium sp. NKUCC04_CG TaxID=2842121 RepID=UPI001C5B503E|nr:hypothetical protein [Flavobacterium sp. NKUCC04_CG]MBW3517906.1 hypothetical protein [Flavobacterium sp. NKUCC04_CG]
MKTRFLLLLLLFFSCQPKKERIDKIVHPKIEVEYSRFFVGDINNDQEKDTAFVILKREIETGELVSEGNNYTINIEFSNGIPKISIDHSLGVFVAKTEDLNGDEANEIILFSRTNEGYWNDISVWSFMGGKWNQIGHTKAFVSENKDFENRIINEHGEYFLIGEDPWELDALGKFKRIRVKIVK